MCVTGCFVQKAPSKAKSATKKNVTKDKYTALTKMFSCITTTAVKYQPTRFTTKPKTKTDTSTMANPMAKERVLPKAKAGVKNM
jgi:hypothetical protein